MTCTLKEINDIIDSASNDLPEYLGEIFVNICNLPKEWLRTLNVFQQYDPGKMNFYDAIDNSKDIINNEFNNFLINICQNKCIKNKYLLTELLLTYDNNSITKIILHALSTVFNKNIHNKEINILKLLLLASTINLLDLINYNNLEIDELLYITLFIYYIKKNKYNLMNYESNNNICFENPIINRHENYYIDPLYIIICKLIKYNYTNMSLPELVNNTQRNKLLIESSLKELVEKNKKLDDNARHNKLESNVKELVEKNNKVESNVKELVEKINNLESNVKELVDKNNKLETIIKELVNKNNNILSNEELRNEINIYKTIVNNLITIKK